MTSPGLRAWLVLGSFCLGASACRLLCIEDSACDDVCRGKPAPWMPSYCAEIDCTCPVSSNGSSADDAGSSQSPADRCAHLRAVEPSLDIADILIDAEASIWKEKRPVHRELWRDEVATRVNASCWPARRVDASADQCTHCTWSIAADGGRSDVLCRPSTECSETTLGNPEVAAIDMQLQLDCEHGTAALVTEGAFVLPDIPEQSSYSCATQGDWLVLTLKEEPTVVRGCIWGWGKAPRHVGGDAPWVFPPGTMRSTCDPVLYHRVGDVAEPVERDEVICDDGASWIP